MNIWGAHACSVLAMAFCHRELCDYEEELMSDLDYNAPSPRHDFKMKQRVL
jgi:hypothetical protein